MTRCTSREGWMTNPLSVVRPQKSGSRHKEPTRSPRAALANVGPQPVTVKVITVEPGRCLSLQRHELRGEMWHVLDVPIDVTPNEQQRNHGGAIAWRWPSVTATKATLSDWKTTTRGKRRMGQMNTSIHFPEDLRRHPAHEVTPRGVATPGRAGSWGEPSDWDTLAL